MTASFKDTAVRSLQAETAFPPVKPWARHYPDGVAAELEIPNLPLTAFLERAAQTYGDRPAVTFAGHTYDYKSLEQVVRRAAKGLSLLGAGPGVKVGLFMPNAAAGVVMYYAALKTGATVVNYNPAYPVADLAAQAVDSETAILVTLDQSALLEKAAGMIGDSRIRNLVVCPAADNLLSPEMPEALLGASHAVPFADLVNNDGRFDGPVISGDDIAVLQYTGGTTGTPKGAMLTHKNLVANAMQVAEWYYCADQGRDSMIVVLPLFHVFAMTVAMNMPVMKGMHMLIQPQFSISDILSLIRDERPAFISCVPTMYIALANDSRVSEVDFSCFKFCLSGGAPLPADVKRLFEEKTGAKLVAEGYGLTEFSPVATCNPLTEKARAGSIGLPIPATDVRIVSLTDGKTPMPAGEAGEVVVRGPQMMKGYYKRDAETAEVIRDGWLHTGDVGYMDADGFVYIVDRVKDMVLVGGYNVYPRHVEEVIYTHPAAEECIVAGVPDNLRGEVVHAWVKRRAGQDLQPEDLREFLRGKLSATEMPRRIFVRDTGLPRTAVGKLSKRDLLAQEGYAK